MNERFKFRVFDKNYNDYLPCSDCQLDARTGKLVKQSLFQANRYIIEQCTGLADKNGKLIYENDIVQYNDQECGTVIFRDGCWVWDWKVNDPPLYLLESYYLKIIGNVHEMELKK